MQLYWIGYELLVEVKPNYWMNVGYIQHIKSDHQNHWRVWSRTDRFGILRAKCRMVGQYPTWTAKAAKERLETHVNEKGIRWQMTNL